MQISSGSSTVRSSGKYSSSPSRFRRIIFCESTPLCFMGNQPLNGIMGTVEICHLYISPGHNFVGHHGREPGAYPMSEVPMIECVAGRGIRGDRYFDFKDDYKGQITFFSLDVFDQLCQALGLRQRSPAEARRNISMRGADLNQMIGQDFEVQGVRFHGMEECRPCYWMNRAIAPGAEEFLKCRGGLRAKILNDGKLRSSADAIRVDARESSIASPFARERAG